MKIAKSHSAISEAAVPVSSGAWRLLRVLFVVTLVIGQILDVGLLTSSFAATGRGPKETKATRQILANLTAAIAADPTKAVQVMQDAMRAHPKIAGKIVKAAIKALPKKDGEPDTYGIAQLITAAVNLIYAEFPDARPEVSSLVLAAIEALRNSAGVIDPKAAMIVLSAVLPIIAANDHGVVDPLIAGVLALVPDAAGMINQLLADLFTPLESTASRLGRRSIQVEPNFIDTAP